MYVHLGGDRIIRANELIAIFDISIEKSSKISKQFLQQTNDHLSVERISDEEAKSLVITKNQVYYSPISSTTLKKRVNQLNI